MTNLFLSEQQVHRLCALRPVRGHPLAPPHRRQRPHPRHRRGGRTHPLGSHAFQPRATGKFWFNYLPNYRVTIQVVSEVVLTPKQKLRISMYEAHVLKNIICFVVNGRLETIWKVTVYSAVQINMAWGCVIADFTQPMTTICIQQAVSCPKIESNDCNLF